MDNNSKNVGNQKTRWWLVITLAVGFFILVLIILGTYGWFMQKQKRVLAGTARPTFPYNDYSMEELNKLNPQYPNADIATTRTPEQTHDLFVAAVKKGDFEEAANCCFRSGDRVKTVEFLNDLKKKNMIDLMVGDITRDFEKHLMFDTKATYVYNGTNKKGERSGGFMNFIKASDGVWYIESL